MGSNGLQKVIISLGGSLIVPNGGIDTDFLSRFNKFVRAQLAEDKNRQFFLVIGGGATARNYRDAGKAVIGEITEDDMDWLGIHATRMNAHLMRTIFHDIAHPHIIEHYEVIRKAIEPVVVASGWKPGWSTDYCAVLLAEDYDIKTILNLSNITRVYDKDPRQFPNALPIDKINWEDFCKLVGDTWAPGMNAPFDPIAAKKAQQLQLKVVVLDGKDFTNMRQYFAGEKFVGTTIE